MDSSNDFLNNARSFGSTPSFHKVEILKGEIIYVPDRDNYPSYWEGKDREDIEACKLKCSYKEKISRVIDYMREQKIFFNLESFAIVNYFPSEEAVKTIEEEYFELSRSELIVLTPDYNITPFVYYQLAKSCSNKARQSYTSDSMCCTIACEQEQNWKILLLRGFLNSQPRIIISWQDYVTFLKERNFDIPQYSVPEY